MGYNGIPMEYLWNTNGIQMEHQWNTMEHIWNTNGMQWNTYGIQWDTNGILMEYNGISSDAVLEDHPQNLKMATDLQKPPMCPSHLTNA